MDQTQKMEFLKNSIMKSKEVMKRTDAMNGTPGSTRKPNAYPPAAIEQLPENVQPPTGTQINMDNLKHSKMPSEILESFAKNPPKSQDIGPSGGMGLSFLDQIAGEIPKNEPVQQPIQEQAPIYQQPVIPSAAGPLSGLQLEGLKAVLKEVVREVVTEVMAEKEQLSEATEIDENIQIKLNNKVFGGKITTLKQLKS